MTPTNMTLDAGSPPSRPAAGPPVRVVEPVRRVDSALTESFSVCGASDLAIRPGERLSLWLVRLLVVWGLLSLASLLNSCRPSPAPAWAASPEASP